MSTLTQHQVVLHWYEREDFRSARPRPQPVGEPVYFTKEHTPQYAMIDGLAVKLDYDVWQDMGGPTDITVTITPGDSLNP